MPYFFDFNCIFSQVYLCQTKDRLQNYAVKQVDRCKTSGDQEAQQVQLLKKNVERK